MAKHYVLGEPKVTLREAFIEQFGEAIASKIEAAAESHKNRVHDNPGEDYFVWALMIAIGFECVTRFRYHHGLEQLDPEELGKWTRLNAEEIKTFNGDVDFLALATGRYNYWLGLEGLPLKEESD